jgi:tryptophan synthase alpha chain
VTTRSIGEAFERAQSEGRSAFVPYLTAGFPDRATFLKTAAELLETADVLEVGLPFSDPLGDGPTIQRSSEAAIASGVTTQAVLEMVHELTSNADAPVVIMSYYNPIFCYEDGGEQGFVKAAKEAGAEVLGYVRLEVGEPSG